MKRFTATEKWGKEWFQKLTPSQKCFWQFICDNCDNAGVWDSNFGLAGFLIGDVFTVDSLKAFGDRIEHIGGTKYWVVDFIEFQYGELSEECRAHGPIFKSIEKNGLSDRVFNGYSKGLDTHKEKEEEKEKEKEKTPPGLPVEVVLWNSRPELPQVKSVSSDRMASLRARRRDKFFTENYQEAIGRIPNSPFLMGKNDRNWKADFDWFIRPGSVAKIMEGKYYDSGPGLSAEENQKRIAKLSEEFKYATPERQAEIRKEIERLKNV